MGRLLIILSGLCIMLSAGCNSIQRKFLFYPTHSPDGKGLAAWKVQDRVIGWAKEVPSPENIWLMLHGNAGQASDRVYALPAFSERDSVFILEYPGYGVRQGKPSKSAFDSAAAGAYKLLRQKFPNRPVCVVGESIGSGPACTLAA